MIWLWLTLQALTVLGVWNYAHNLPVDRQEEHPAGVVVILSVRDDWDGSPALMDALWQQSAPFRLLLATSGDCPAAAALSLANPGRVQVISAGIAHDEGQKVHKLRAAVRALRGDDAYLVFIDADILPSHRLIGRLLFPLVRGKADIVTGYRLLIPGIGWPASLVSAVEMQLATLPRAAGSTMPWGGAMAMTRSTAQRLDINAVLAGRLSDDLAIGQAGWRARLRMRPVRDLLVASPIGGAMASLWAFGVRQYRHIWTNSPSMWAIATFAVALQTVGWLWAILSGSWVAIAVGYAAAWLRALLRWHIVGSVLSPAQARAVRRSLAWDVIAPFIPTIAHLAVQLQAAMSHRIEWGGWAYRITRGKVTAMQKIGS